MIFELLTEGKANKRTRGELLERLNIPMREFHNVLRKERREGHLIMSTKENGGGYWLWDGEDIGELERYYFMQRSGAVDTLETLKPIYQIIKHRIPEGQLTVEELSNNE